ncbi:TPA: hypothetical protein ACS62H_004637 [Klebsiella pneumoniae]
MMVNSQTMQNGLYSSVAVYFCLRFVEGLVLPFGVFIGLGWLWTVVLAMVVGIVPGVYASRRGFSKRIKRIGLAIDFFGFLAGFIAIAALR